MTPGSLARSETFEDPQGHATLECDAFGVVRFVAVGHYTVALSTQAAEMMTELAQGGAPLRVFSDFSKLTGYDSESRAHATEWCREHFRMLASVHVLSRPGIVAMGVATAAMTLSIMGLNMKAYTERWMFLDALESTKREAQVP